MNRQPRTGDFVTSYGDFSAGSMWKWYSQGGDIILFAVYSLGMKLFIGQEQIVSRTDLVYWLLVVPALLLPALRLRQTIGNLLMGVARPFAVLGLIAGLWCLISKDYSVVPQLVLLVWVAGWATRSEVRLDLRLLMVALLFFYVAGIVKYYVQNDYENHEWLMSEYMPSKAATKFDEEQGLADLQQPELPDQELSGLHLNAWGILPGQTAPAYGPWRISVTPNIASSGIVSVLVIMLSLVWFRPRPLNVATLAFGLYFAILSFVRSALIALVVFAGSQALLRLVPPRWKLVRVIVVFLLMGGAVGALWLAPYIIYKIQDVELVSRLFLRGESGLSLADIYRQVYRSWLWSQHVQIFLSSDYLMGQGGELAKSAERAMINYGQPRSDSTAFPTRMLATYGLPALALVWFIGERCIAHARVNDIWALSVIPALVWLMMTWGAAFHPTNIVYVLALLIIARGSNAFVYAGRNGQ